MPDTTDPLPAALSDRYRILRSIGEGGMATVFLAEDLKHHRRVAIKVLRPELVAAVGQDRFLREIDLTAGLQHPHILPLFDSGEAGGRLFYVMPYVAGESLRDRLAREGRLPVADALAIAGDVAAALTWAHARGIVHRDVKPENILLSEGEALVADFGIALALERETHGRLTTAGLSVGTPAYMSPEQVAGDERLDGRSDVHALACVLFEMLAGAPPFAGPSAQATLGKVMTEPPPHVRSLRAEVPAEVDAALVRALAKSPADRFATPREFIDACAAPRARPVRRRRIAAGAAILLVVAAVALWPVWREVRATRARATLPAIEELAAKGRYAEAYAMARRAEERIGEDSVLSRLMREVSDLLTVTSEPSGARVWLQRLPDDTSAVGDSVPLGTTPVTSRRVARGDHRVSVQLDGHAPVERLASSTIGRMDLAGGDGRAVRLALALPRREAIPDGMVAVPGGRYTMVSPDLPTGLTATLRPFLLDRFEVSNDDYRRFLRSGGARAGATAGAEVPAEGFVDRTGLPGPRDWVNQEPPAGRGDHPVTGVSWYEAEAFCAAQGRRLPTIYEWEKSARDGRVSWAGVIMPWGYASAAASAERRANFGGSGTAPVDAFPFGIGPYGAHALAGNVKEWLRNASNDGFVVAGGSWQDPAYLFSSLGSQPGRTASPALGFRCARDATPGPGDQGAGPVPLRAPPPAYRPVDDATFRSFLAFYRYDRRPADARVTGVVETADWRRERIRITGIGDDSILVYLYLPTRARAPFQTIVHVPSSAAFLYAPVWRLTEDELGPHVKAGRAVATPVLRGMAERPEPPGWTPPPSASVGFRDRMVRHATELRMALDYLVSRPEIDGSRLAYVASSFGAGSRLPLAAVDDRFRAVVLVGAGIDERLQPTLPEAANFNFAPRIRAPKLVVNGRQDEEHPWLTRGLPLWNLLREPKELVLIDGAGHLPPLEMRVPPINAFLDRTLGPVARAP